MVPTAPASLEAGLHWEAQLASQLSPAGSRAVFEPRQGLAGDRVQLSCSGASHRPAVGWGKPLCDGGLTPTGLSHVSPRSSPPVGTPGQENLECPEPGRASGTGVQRQAVPVGLRLLLGCADVHPGPAPALLWWARRLGRGSFGSALLQDRLDTFIFMQRQPKLESVCLQ